MPRKMRLAAANRTEVALRPAEHRCPPAMSSCGRETRVNGGRTPERDREIMIQDWRGEKEH
jgi:hypothetical protein